MLYHKPYFLFLGLTLIGGVAGAQEVPYYHHDRSLKPAEINIQEIPTLNAKTERLTKVVKGKPVKIDTNGTYAIEREAIAMGYRSASEAWNAVVNYNVSERRHPGKIFNNVGWVRSTKAVRGKWGACLWTLRNRIAFRSSETNWWVTSNGIPVAITKVTVGSLGDYPPMTNVMDIGPDISMATNFPGADNGDEGIYQVDVVNVYYQLMIPDIRITPREAVVEMGSTNSVRFTLTGTNIPNGVTWTISPSVPAGVAVMQINNNWHYKDIAPGTLATNYTIRATSVDNTNFYDEAKLEVVKVDVAETNIYINVSNTITLHLTPKSSRDVRWEIMPILQNGARIEGSAVGTSAVVNTGSIATNYTVKACAAKLTNCFDTCTMTVIKVNFAVDNNRDGSITFDTVDRTSRTRPFSFWINNDCDSEKGDNPDGRAPNYSDKNINGIRDLEDFARLHINLSGILPLLKKSELRLALKFRNTTGKPAINLWKAVDSDGGEGYLTDLGVARQYLNRPMIGYITTDQSYTIDQQFWNELGAGAQSVYLLFEGAGTGKGELAVDVIKNSNVVCEVQGVWMDLKDIKAMYERAKATPETIESPYNFTHPNDNPPEPNMGWMADSNGHPFEPAWDEDARNRNYIIFVHGWNMSYNASINYAETMFKRLWWRGYKGRFVFFRWPTYWNRSTPISPVNAYLARYNETEYIAWKSGRSLRQFVDSLPNGYTRNIAAHSMGNIVVGSALQQGMIVANYALLQAAVPACCYDVRPALNQAPRRDLFGFMYWNTPTPDNDSDPTTRSLAYRGQLQNVRGNLVNFFLPEDIATTTAWEFNNDRFKPYNPRGYGQYYYNTNAPAGQKLGIRFSSSVNRFARTSHEAMAFVDQSPTKVVGAEGRTREAIDISVNLSDPIYGGKKGFDREHSAEFDRHIQILQVFYYDLLDYTGIEQNYLDEAHP